MAPRASLIIRPVPFERNWIMAAVICPLRLQAWSCWHFALVGDLIVAVTVFFFPCCICLSSYFLQAHKGVNRCTVVTGSSLDGHSSVKVWGQHTQVSIPSSSSSMLTLLLENRPPCPHQQTRGGSVQSGTVCLSITAAIEAPARWGSRHWP